MNPTVAVLLGWARAGEHVGTCEVVAGLVILASVALLVLARTPRMQPEPIPDSLPPCIRAKDAQLVELRQTPGLAELHRIAA